MRKPGAIGRRWAGPFSPSSPGNSSASASLLWLRAGAWNSILETPYDGVLVTLFIVISNPVTIAVLALAVWLARADPADYLALKWPRARDVMLGLGCLVGFIAVCDALLYFSGHALVTPFQLQSYTTAGHGGLAAGHVARRDHRRAGGRRDHVPRLSVPRLGALGAHRHGRRSS